MKVSVSLPEEDLEFLDRFAVSQGIESRSAVLHRAIRLLRASELGDAYADAWQEWEADGEAQAWEPAAADGLSR
jgi:Arc/MetJ-type ribon-helix-helix transcriptional regulator